MEGPHSAAAGRCGGMRSETLTPQIHYSIMKPPYTSADKPGGIGREVRPFVFPRIIRRFLLISFFLVSMSLYGLAEVKPYRVLLVISDQWKDPRSFLVSGGGEFQTMVTLFKSGESPSIFCDSTRPSWIRVISRTSGESLVTGRLSGTRLVKFPISDGTLIRDAVERLHISLVAVGNRVQQPEIQRLLGIRYKAEHMHSSHPTADGPSFILRGLPADLHEQGPAAVAMRRVQVDLAEAHALATAAGMPQITTRELADDTRAIWIGGDVDQMLLYQPIRTALRRAITEAIGYSLVKTWTHDIVLTMDDLGNAQNSWLEHWHYPALSQDQIRRYLIEPLKAHHAVLSINTVPDSSMTRSGALCPPGSSNLRMVLAPGKIMFDQKRLRRGYRRRGLRNRKPWLDTHATGFELGAGTVVGNSVGRGTGRDGLVPRVL